MMQTLSIGELKSKFSEVLGRLRGGQEILISYGKKRKR
jgi:antitoxin (DNA-binding transcriptional repressor) of toxin-antitoxin stability system